MTTAVIEQLPLLASAPGGGAGLRRLILDLAVAGRLVPQAPADESAEELLARATAVKAAMGSTRKARGGASKSGPATWDHLPSGWVLVRLGELTTKLGAGSTPLGGKQVYTPEGVLFLRSQNVWNEGLRLDDVARIPAAIHADRAGTHVFAGDLLFNITGASIGRCAIVPSPFEGGNVSQHVVIVRPALPELQAYLHKVLTSDLVQDAVMAEQVGVSREGLSVAKLSEFQIPLPPLEEQHRIVAKVDELMALCDRLEARQQDAEAAHARLVQALLDSLTQARDADEFQACWQRVVGQFEMLLTRVESVDALKQVVLSLAVAGHLTDAVLGDGEAGSELANHRIASKAHPRKGWAAAALGDLGSVLGGATPSKARPDFWAGPIPWVSPKDMKRLEIADAEDHVSAAALDSSPLKLVPANSILMVVRGMILVHSFPVARTLAPVTINQDMKALVPPADLVPYLLLALQALKPQIVATVDRSSHGTCKLVSEKLWSIEIGVPPLAEQHRIVAKVTELLALCDQLKARITAARAKHAQLAEALVAQAVAA